MIRTLPEDQSSGSVVAALLPASAHYVKAFGTLGADASRAPRTANRGGPCSSTRRTTTRPRRGRTADPCRRLRAAEGGRRRRRWTARGARRRPSPRWRLERPARRPRRSARHGRGGECRHEHNRHIRTAGLRAGPALGARPRAQRAGLLRRPRRAEPVLDHRRHLPVGVPDDLGRRRAARRAARRSATTSSAPSTRSRPPTASATR